MWQELVPAPGEAMSLDDIDRKIDALNQEFQELFQKSKGGNFMKYAEEFTKINESMAALKDKRNAMLERQTSNSAANKRIGDAINTLNTGSADINEWDESIIRQLVDTVKVMSKDRIVVYLRGGIEVQQDMIY